MIKRFFALCSMMILSLTVCASAGAAESSEIVETFTEESFAQWTAGGTANIAVNTDLQYVKDGDTSLQVKYPKSNRGTEINIINNNWKNGGLQLPDIDEGMIVSKIGMWVYGCNDDNVQLSIFTKNQNTSSMVESAKTLLNFSDWKYIEFDVDSTTNFLYSIVVKRVERKENPEDKYLYIDAVSVRYSYDPSARQDFKAECSVADGAARVHLDAELVYTFTNPIDESNLFQAAVEPATAFKIEKISSKSYKLIFDEDLQATTQYRVTLSGITDVFGQVIDELAISFRTVDFDMQTLSIINNGSAIESAVGAEPGTLEMSVSVQSFRAGEQETEAYMFCSLYDENGYMIGVDCKKLVLSDQKNTVDLTMTPSATVKRAEIFLIDSLDTRGIIEHIHMGDNA